MGGRVGFRDTGMDYLLTSVYSSLGQYDYYEGKQTGHL